MGKGFNGKNRMKYVKVVWKDSIFEAGWRKYTKSKMKCITVGILYKKLKDRVIIAQSKSPYQYGEYLEIPKCSIIKIIKLHKRFK